MAADDISAFAAIGALEEPVRRGLYRFVSTRGAPVSRQEAAADAGISTNLAAFHLDKLVDLGLLRSHYGKATGAPFSRGRPPKLYEPGDGEISMSLPPRRYDLCAEIMVEALEPEAAGGSLRDSVLRVAHRRGLGIGAELKEAGSTEVEPMAASATVLAEWGYEPYIEDGKVLRVRNCPFHRLAQQSRDLVCSMNRSFVSGIVEGLAGGALTVGLEPIAGQCCVAIAPKEAA